MYWDISTASVSLQIWFYNGVHSHVKRYGNIPWRTYLHNEKQETEFQGEADLDKGSDTSEVKNACNEEVRSPFHNDILDEYKVFA